MAIQELKKQSDLEKRLQILRRQVYGKQEFRAQKDSLSHPVQTSSSLTDLSYLYHDLLKTLLFSSLAIGAQILLFFLMKNHILNINL